MVYTVLVFDEMTMDVITVFEGNRTECDEFIQTIDMDIDYDIVITD